MEATAFAILEPLYEKTIKEKPLVTLSFAQSLNGIIGSFQDRLILSSPESFSFTHCIRHSNDAILVGIGTVLADNPRLTTRITSKTPRNARPVLLDSQLRIPVDSFIAQNPNLIIFTTRKASTDKLELLISRDISIHILDDDEMLDLTKVLGILKNEYSVDRLMVEGGAAVIKDFLSKRLVDILIAFISPQILVDGPRVDISSNLSLNAQWMQSGRDSVLISRLE